MEIFIFKGLTALCLCKSFGVKGLTSQGVSYIGLVTEDGCQLLSTNHVVSTGSNMERLCWMFWS
jgi:hypothetical protein